ncbi:hypothetical protein LTR36_003600 [Oleoguttula mirabilis]|uniref:Prion-inhibition and propagation HeLo domain-containing protein n=1 Tax=Oleoguttula mirabilis TaxID=1507867 RepID=A0AAV9JJB6_9PEZI|nr:hypothetical protein LTR36_003600 [Oleoguttula mirabilis]
MGAASLFSLFDTALTVFSYVEKGRNFGADFQTSEVKLRVAGLRFTRWGQAIGLASSPDDSSLIEGMNLVDTDLIAPKMLLSQIGRLMKDADDMSRKYGMEEAHNTIQDTNEGGTVEEEGAVVLVGEQELNKLLDTVTGLIGSFEALFPAAEQTRQHLADQEAHEPRQVAGELLAFMKEVAAGRKSDDRVLEEALRKEAQADANTAPAHQTTNTWGDNNGGFQIGSMSGGGTFNMGPR